MAIAGVVGSPLAGQRPRALEDGVYSEGQALRGQRLYQQRCASCHGQALAGGNGPPLTGRAFLDVWAGMSLSDLAGKIRTTMPADGPGTLDGEQTSALVAFVLRSGRFPAGGSELALDGQNAAVGFPAVVSAARPMSRSDGPQFPPAGNLAQVMRGILFPSSNLIFNVQTHNPSDPPRPAASPDSGGFSWVDWGAGIYGPWQLVDVAAIALAESAPLMLTPGRRCENGRAVPVDRPDWIAFTRELAEAGRAAYRASQTRSQDAVSEATNQIVDACLHCHQVYRDRRPVRGADPSDTSWRCAVP